MRKYPDELFYTGNLTLLKKEKISIVGTRRPSSYTKLQTARIATELSKRGVCIVSGVAMGVDTIAHKNAQIKNTIAVVANGLDIRYPSINRAMIKEIESEGLVLSQFKEGFRATPWSFVVRNEIVVSLGDILIVAEADLKSGSMRSVDYALKMEKKIFVLPHRIGESEGTSYLLKNNLATAIYDIDDFVAKFGSTCKVEYNDFIEFCKLNPTYEEAINRYGDKVLEYELDGKISIKNNTVVIS